MKQITRTLTLVLTLTTLLCVTLIPAQAAAYSAELDFLDKATYESYIVFNNGLKAAGDSTKMGYKGWISSTNKSGTTVFAFKAEEGKTFDSFTFTYSGYSIAVEETDIYDIYVSTTAEDWSDPALVYNEKDWTLVSALRNDDKLAGTGVYPKDPTNRDAALRRSVDLSSFAKGKDTVYVRVDSYRSTNIDGLPTVFGGAYAVTAEYTAAETTAIPMTTAASTTTAAPVTTATPTTTAAPVTTAAPAQTPATADTTMIPLACAALALAAVCCLRRKEGKDD